MQGPRANWACLSKTCQQDGAATIYELPVSATRCPVCGSKRITRLYDAVNVLSGLARRTDALVEPAYAEVTRNQDSVRRAERQNGPSLAVPIGQLGATLARFGAPGMRIAASEGKGQGLSQAPPGEAFGSFQRQTPKPHVVARDTEFTLGRDAHGMPVARKA